MKTPRLLALAAVTLIAGASASLPAQAADAHHHHGDSHAGEPTLHLNAGRQWATDTPLRQSMDGINRAMAKALPAIHHSRFGEADYDALAMARLMPSRDWRSGVSVAHFLPASRCSVGVVASP